MLIEALPKCLLIIATVYGGSEHIVRVFPFRVTKSSLANISLWLIIAMLAGGATIGNNLQPSRLLTIAVFLIIILSGKVVKPSTLQYKIFILMTSIWFIWGIASLLWTPATSQGIDEMIIITLGFLTIFTFINLVRHTKSGFNAIRIGWVSAYLLTIPLAIWELVTNQHLSNTMGQIETGDEFITSFFYTATTFGNRNNYSAFIVLCFPFLLWSFEQAKGTIVRCCYVLIIASAIFFPVVNCSRLGMISLAFQTLFFLFVSVKHSSYLIKKLFLVIILCVVTLLAFQFQPASLGRLQGLKEGIHGKSIDARTNIYKNGLALIKSTFGLGVGAGGYEESINNNPKMLFTNYIGSAHNLWIEVFANYGGIVWGVFVGWLLVTFWSASKIRKWAEIKNHILIERAMRHTLILMVGLPVGCMLNSSILRWTMLWTAFATIAAMLEMSKRQ